MDDGGVKIYFNTPQGIEIGFKGNDDFVEFYCRPGGALRLIVYSDDRQVEIDLTPDHVSEMVEWLTQWKAGRNG